MKTYGNLSLPQLGRLIRQGLISCEELAYNVITDIRERNHWLNSFVRVTEQRALAEAATADLELRQGIDRGVFHGIPYAVKDLFDVEGHPTTGGIPDPHRSPAQNDAAVVRRFREMGAVLVGHTQSSPLAATIIGINHGYGTPRNPWKLEPYILGGSSSGSAVAVSSGQVPFALGTDTGGSVRTPAALCGIVGFRPAAGVIDLEGCQVLAPSLDAAGCLCRTVDDAAAIYGALRGRPFEPADSVEGVRVALPEILFDQARSDMQREVQRVVDRLPSLGAKVEIVSFPELEEVQMLMMETSLIAAEAYPRYSHYIEDPGSDWVLHWMRKARTYSAFRMEEFHRRHHRLKVALAERFRRFDAILAPATPLPALPLKDCNEPESHAAFSALLSGGTLTGNLAGWSGICVPCSILKEGLPTATVVLTDPQKEQVGFALASQLETLSSFRAGHPDPPYAFPLA